MKKLLKKFKFALIVVLSVLVFAFGSGCSTTSNSSDKILEFYDAVLVSQECLDEVADDIYSYWYDAIYKDYYQGNINIAIASARVDNSDNLTTIEDNDAIIKALYKEVKDSDLSAEIKAVMSSYSDYYEFVVNVSGSFNSYKDGKETYKKALASDLKKLSLEM